jgi:hypothetical protein
MKIDWPSTSSSSVMAAEMEGWLQLHGGSGQVSVLGRCEGVAKLPECELHSFFRGDASGLIILSFML